MENLRRSSHTILVKLDSEKDKYMLVHGYTGAIDVISAQVADYIKAHETINDRVEFPFSDSLLQGLTNRGYYTVRTPEQEEEYIVKMADLLHRARKAMMKSFMFIIAYDCNFRCPYCYESSVSDDGCGWSGKVFTKELADKAFNAIFKLEPDSRLHYKRITLYGGEPLQEHNKDIVKYIVEKGKGLGFNFEAVTNGYDLDHFLDLLSPDQISAIQITIDGVKDKHDSRRFHYRHGASFDRIIDNIGKALQKNIRINIRVNTDWNNFEDLKQLAAIFRDKGFTGNKNFAMYSALLVDYNDNATPGQSSSTLGFMTRKEYNREHRNEKFRYGCQDSGIYARLSSAIKNNKPLNFQSVYCGAQSGHYILDPFGKLYSCWAMIGKKQHCWGNYNSNEIEWTGEKEKWHNWNISMSPTCKKCKYSFFCGGGCLERAMALNGSFGKGFCNDFADTFKTMINRVYDKHLSEKSQGAF